LPNTKSAEKRVRQVVARTERNRRAKSMVKTSIRRFEEALKSGDQESAQARLLAAIRQIDKAAAKGIVHKNNAARKKSRLTRMLNDSAAG
jgi:small subunit ribosomal protein S20